MRVLRAPGDRGLHVVPGQPVDGHRRRPSPSDVARPTPAAATAISTDSSVDLPEPDGPVTTSQPEPAVGDQVQVAQHGGPPRPAGGEVLGGQLAHRRGAATRSAGAGSAATGSASTAATRARASRQASRWRSAAPIAVSGSSSASGASARTAATGADELPGPHRGGARGHREHGGRTRWRARPVASPTRGGRGAGAAARPCRRPSASSRSARGRREPVRPQVRGGLQGGGGLPQASTVCSSARGPGHAGGRPSGARRRPPAPRRPAPRRPARRRSGSRTREHRRRAR